MDLVQITENDKTNRVGKIIFELILAVSLSVGCWYTYFSMFPNPANPVISVLLITVLPVGLYFMCKLPAVGRFLAFYAFILTAVYFVMFYTHVWNGFVVLVNIAIEVLNNQFNAGLVPFEISGDVTLWATDTLMALMPVIFLESVAIAYSVAYKEPFIGFIFTAFPVIAGLCFKGEPSIWLLVLMLLCWMGLMVLSAVARPAAGNKKKPIYIQNPKHSKLPYIFLGVSLILMAGYVLVFSGDDYTPPNSVDEAKKAVIEAEEHLRYDKLNGDEIDTLSKGDLTKTHPLEYTDNTVFELKIQQPESMYLRAFVGGYFKNGRWNEAPEEAYAGEYAGAMEWLAQEKFYPWMQQERLYRMSKNYDYVKVTLKNINGNSKYTYLPYEAVLTGDTMPDKVNYKKDYGAFSKGFTGDREYTFKTFIPRMDDYSEGEIAKWIAEVKQFSDWDDYAEKEAVYRRFVYDTYLYIEPEDYELLKSVGAEKCLGRTIEYTLYYVRDLFNKEFTYDTERDKAPKGKDELEYFLNKKKGNDMHFATVATLLFRSAGIPARYAEGYYLSKQQMDLYEGSDNIRYNVTDTDAHCWIEIYIDEVGWFPVEIIPGFYQMQKQETEEKEDKEELKNETNETYEDRVPENDKPEKKEEKEENKFNPLWLLPLLIILLIALFEVIGRRHIKKKLESFNTEINDAKVFEIYKYTCRLMAIDGNKVPRNPYDCLDRNGNRYDASKGCPMSYGEFLRLVNRVRFGKESLSEEEQKKTASYAVYIGRFAYAEKGRFKKFIMKYIIFCV